MTSKRTLEQRLDRIDDGKEYPKLSLATLIAAEQIEEIDDERDRDLVRIDGQIYEGRELKQAMLENFDCLEGPENRTDES